MTLDIEGMEAVLESIARIPDTLQAGVKVTGDAVAYAIIWEEGRITCNPGPKTMWSTNAAGDRRVMTITAPHGFIRANKEKFDAILKEEIEALDLGSDMGQWEEKMNGALKIAAQRCAEIISDAAPIDTGLLKASISAAEPGDELLSSSEGTVFDLGSVL
jgi:hypothetical protein